MVYVKSTSRYITSASCNHPRYQSRSSMYICGLIHGISRNWPRQLRLPKLLGEISPNFKGMILVWSSGPHATLFNIFKFYTGYHGNKKGKTFKKFVFNKRDMDGYLRSAPLILRSYRHGIGRLCV